MRIVGWSSGPQTILSSAGHTPEQLRAQADRSGADASSGAVPRPPGSCPQIPISGGGSGPPSARWKHVSSPPLARPPLALPPDSARPLPPGHALLALAGGPSRRGPARLRPARTALASRAPGRGPGRRTGAADPPGGPWCGALRRPDRGGGSGERLPRGPAHHLPPCGRHRRPGRPGGRRSPGHAVRRAPALSGPSLPPLGSAPRLRLPGPPRPPGPRRDPPAAPPPGGGGRTGCGPAAGPLPRPGPREPAGPLSRSPGPHRSGRQARTRHPDREAPSRNHAQGPPLSAAATRPPRPHRSGPPGRERPRSGPSAGTMADGGDSLSRTDHRGRAPVRPAPGGTRHPSRGNPEQEPWRTEWLPCVRKSQRCQVEARPAPGSVPCALRRGGGPVGRRCAGAPRRRGCRSACCAGWSGRGTPGRCAGRLRR